MKRNHIRIIFLIIITFCFQSLYSERLGSLLREQSGGFSFRIPEDWQVLEYPSLKYRIAVGRIAAGFRPNMNVVDEEFSGDMESYTQASIANIAQYFPSFKLISTTDFKTSSGITGKKIITQVKQRGNPLQQVYYLFKGKRGKYLVITCSTLQADGDAYLPIFDRCIRTLELF